MSGLLKIAENLVNCFEDVVQIFRCSAAAEEVVAIGVFDEEVGMGDVVSEVGNFVEARTGGAFY